MIKENDKQLIILSFLSGKGGSGKTTAALAISKILADVGFRILLVDFDFATSGASYFFLPILSNSTKKGLLYLIKRYSDGSNETSNSVINFKDLVISIGPNFDYIPSRTDIGSPFPISPEIVTKDFTINEILDPLIKEIGNNYDYLLLDNQAGYTPSSAAAAKIADKAIVVSESDRISSDAVDNLIALIGTDMPRFRRYLINKVEIKESGDYRSKVEAFKSMNRLPPLPFDFSVRNSFGDREIPVDLEQPTSFLLALFTTVKEIIPENKLTLEKYENEKVTKLFDQYQEKLDKLLERRSEIQEKIIEFETIEKMKESEERIFMNRIKTLVSSAIAILAFIVSMFFYLGFQFKSEIVLTSIGVLITVFAVIFTFFLRDRERKLSKSAIAEEGRTKDKLRYQREIAKIETEVNRYNNLMATKSRDLLIDFDNVS